MNFRVQAEKWGCKGTAEKQKNQSGFRKTSWKDVPVVSEKRRLVDLLFIYFLVLLRMSSTKEARAAVAAADTDHVWKAAAV